MFILSHPTIFVVFATFGMSSAQAGAPYIRPKLTNTQPEISIQQTSVAKLQSGCPQSTGDEELRVTAPAEYMFEGQTFDVKCSAKTSKKTSKLSMAIYSGLYFIALKSEDYGGETSISDNEPQGCSYSLSLNLKLRMTEDKDGALLTCFMYNDTAVTPNQLECRQNDNSMCAYGIALKMFRPWPLTSREGKFVIVLVAGWAIILFPIAIYLLWMNTRVLKPSKLVDMGDSSHAEITLK